MVKAECRDTRRDRSCSPKQRDAFHLLHTEEYRVDGPLRRLLYRACARRVLLLALNTFVFLQ